ncbi:Na(+)/dicarboxylate cotransporter 3-like [Amblyomma americanum]
MMFVAALTKTGLAKRVALRMLYALGTSNSSLLLVFMVSTALLSMCLPNTASTAVVAPVVIAVIEQMRCQTRLKRDLSIASAAAAGSTRHVADVYKRAQERMMASLVGMSEESLKDLRRELMVSVAYASSIGGMGTIMGTAPNIILRKLYRRRFPSAPRLETGTWMLTNVPMVVICLLAAWASCRWRLRHIQSEQEEGTKATQEKIKREIERRYLGLGRIRSDELAVLLLMVLLVYLWLFRFRDSRFSWTAFLPEDEQVSVTTGVLMACMPLFVIPSSRQTEAFNNPLKPLDPILTWRHMAPKFYWNLIFLISGSLTFSNAAKASGLSDLIAECLLNLGGLDDTLIVTVLCLLTAALTQLFSNAGVCTMLIPVVLDTAVSLKVHPMLLAMPVTLACSFSFLLPASTPPNALVYEMGGMGCRDMIYPGVVMTIISIIVCVALILSWGRFTMELGEFPSWATENVTSTTPFPIA